MLREEYKVRVFERGALMEIFGLKRDEVTGEWRRLHNEELCALYLLPNIRVIKSKKNQMGGTCGTYGVQERYIQGFGRQTRGKKPTGRPRHRWVDNIKKDLQEVGWKGKVWIDLAQDRDSWLALVNAASNSRVP